MSLKSARDKLIVIDLPASTVVAMDNRIAPYVVRSTRLFNAHVTLHDQMKQLARNCYHQGLIDGAQVGAKMNFHRDPRNVILD